MRRGGATAGGVKNVLEKTPDRNIFTVYLFVLFIIFNDHRRPSL